MQTFSVARFLNKAIKNTILNNFTQLDGSNKKFRLVAGMFSCVFHGPKGFFDGWSYVKVIICHVFHNYPRLKWLGDLFYKNNLFLCMFQFHVDSRKTSCSQKLAQINQRTSNTEMMPILYAKNLELPM